MRPFVLTDTRTVATAITVLQLTAPSTMVVEILSASATQSTSVTSAAAEIALVRKSATATGTTALTPLKLQPGGPAVSSTGARTATGEGTDGDLLIGEGFNILNGWSYVPVPEERIFVPPSGIIALKFTAAPTSATWKTRIVFREIG